MTAEQFESEASNELSSVVGAFDQLPQLQILNLAGNHLWSFEEVGKPMQMDVGRSRQI